MRLALGNNTVVEISEITATPCWCPSKGTTEDNPEVYQVRMALQGWESERDLDIIGEYILDGTIKTYNKAKDNFETVCYKLLTRGWCTSDDFKNFEFF